MLAKGISDVLDKKNNVKSTINASVYVKEFHSLEYISAQYVKVMKTMTNS